MSIAPIDGGIFSFPQSGTIDWVALGNHSVTATVSILSRISASHIDPFTMTVAQAVASQYQLSSKGKARLKEALQSLKSYASVDNVLWFGFGIKHVVRILAQTTHGMSTLALLGGLSEVMSAETVAYILDELPTIYGAPDELRPSLLQWEALVSSCSGVFSCTTFGLVAEHFIQLGDDSPGYSFWHPSGATYSRNCGQPKGVASALYSIARLSRGFLSAVELRGGAVCGLLAAFGFWFLGLEVEIRKGSEVVHRSISEDQPVQIVVTYGDVSDQTSSLDAEVASRSYHICDISSILDGDPDRHGHGDLIISGRISWDGAIRNTFGAVGQELLERRYDLSQILGNGARLFTGVAYAERNDLGIKRPEVSRSVNDFYKFINHNENSHGKGLLYFMISRLPELAAMDRPLMDACLENPIFKAYEGFELAINRLAKLCDCNECLIINSYSKQKSFCLPSLACFILVTLRNLAFVHSDADLKPYRVGLEACYDNYQKFFHTEAMWRWRRISQVSTGHVYQTAEYLYTGRCEKRHLSAKSDPFDGAQVDFESAFSAYGMTFYLNILRGLSDSPSGAAVLHVAPGSLVLESGRVFTTVRDQMPSGAIDYEATNYQPLSSLPVPADTGSAELEARLMVRESVRDLSVAFCFARAGKHLCSIGPTELVRRLALLSYSVPCPRRRCPDMTVPMTSLFQADGEGGAHPSADFQLGRSVVIRRLQGNPVARCMVLAQSGWYGKVILRNDECWPCCVREAFDVSRRQPRDIAQAVYIL